MGGQRQLADAERDGALFVFDLHDAPAPPVVSDEMLRVATFEDAAALQEAMEASGIYGVDTVVMRLRKGRRPYVVATDGMIVSYGWLALTPEPVGDLGFSFRVGPDEGYIYDCATRPAYRGRGYYPALLRFVLADLHNGPCRRAWIATAPGNLVSQRGIIRAGFTKVADVRIRQRPGNAVEVELYGVPGIPVPLLEHGAGAFHGRPFPETGIRAQPLSHH